MAINLKKKKSHKISKELSGYKLYLYGPGGAGKTTLGVSAEKPLLLAFERGFNALNVDAYEEMKTWSDMKQAVRQLKDPELKAEYSTIVIDTVDRASACCEKYICSQLGIENIGDGGWSTNGWAKVKKEWEDTFNALEMEGYSIIYISHSKEKEFKRKDGSTYTEIVPSCSNAYNEIIRNMTDLQGYIDIDGGTRYLVLRSPDNTIQCKSRYKYIEPKITFSYEDLVKALKNAIDKEDEMSGGKAVTSQKNDAPTPVNLDFDALMNKFNTMVASVQKEKNFIDYWQPEIAHIVKHHLNGKKMSECTREQVEQVEVIVSEVEELISKK